MWMLVGMLLHFGLEKGVKKKKLGRFYKVDASQFHIPSLLIFRLRMLSSLIMFQFLQQLEIPSGRIYRRSFT